MQPPAPQPQKGHWEFTNSRSKLGPAVDEHHDMPGVHGVFDVRGFCYLGVSIRPRGLAKKLGYPDYGPEFGVIILNHFIGFWWCED